ncbi:MAG TPA: fasciclin domain-containing protein [Pseudonocardia sp.]|nr:fasciclin domain-containing protein [Pseudonocardia sp.]
MRKIPRLGTAGLLAAIAIGLTACGSPPPEIPPPSTQAEAPTQANTADGVTTSKQLFGAACSQLPQGGVPGSPDRLASQPVVEGLNSNPFSKTFSTAIQKAGLVGALDEAPSVTVFVPYEAAFADLQQQLGPDKYNALLADQKQLADILKYHVLVKRYDRAGLASARQVTTLQGGQLQVADAGDTMNIQDNGKGTAHVLCGNVPTKNATVFFVDKVLMPIVP